MGRLPVAAAQAVATAIAAFFAAVAAFGDSVGIPMWARMVVGGLAVLTAAVVMGLTWVLEWAPYKTAVAQRRRCVTDLIEPRGRGVEQGSRRRILHRPWQRHYGNR